MASASRFNDFQINITTISLKGLFLLTFKEFLVNRSQRAINFGSVAIVFPPIFHVIQVLLQNTLSPTLTSLDNFFNRELAFIIGLFDFVLFSQALAVFRSRFCF